LHAKIAQGQSGKWASGAPFAAELVHFGAPGVLPLVAAAVLGLVHLARAAPARRTAAVMLGLSASIVGGYTVLGIPPYRWYYLPLEATMLLLAAVGLGALLRQGLRILRRPWLVAAPGLVLIGALTVFGLRGPPLNPPDHFGQDKVEPYRQVGAYLHDQAPPGASVALAEVGIIGFVSGIHVVDLLGIVTPWPAETIRRGHDVDQLRQVQADYYLDLSGNMTVPGYRVEATFGPYRLHRRQPGSPGAPP
jgi:hypothetical protein